jgi:hypothetical protein
MKYGDEDRINADHPVPDNTIVTIPLYKYENKNNFIRKAERKRDWFTSHFYKCLPLSIANEMGWELLAPYEFSVKWNGYRDRDGLEFQFPEDPEVMKERHGQWCPTSHFGSGIITMSYPFQFRTPPNINLFIGPPNNYCHPGMTAMAGLIETDNLRHYFTTNIKVSIPDTWLTIAQGAVLATIYPIPRGYTEGYEMVEASEIYSKTIIDKEIEAHHDHSQLRYALESDQDRLYFTGQDVYGNNFSSHQLPSKT